MITLPDEPWQVHWETKHINPQHVDDVVAQVSSHRWIAAVLATCIDDHYGTGPSRVMESMFSTIDCWPRPTNSYDRAQWLDEARLILKRLKELGVVEYGYLGSEDQGELLGRGYWLSTFGKAVLMEMRDRRLYPWDIPT